MNRQAKELGIKLSYVRKGKRYRKTEMRLAKEIEQKQKLAFGKLINYLKKINHELGFGGYGGVGTWVSPHFDASVDALIAAREREDPPATSEELRLLENEVVRQVRKNYGKALDAEMRMRPGMSRRDIDLRRAIAIRSAD